eukprot:UN03190
MEPQYQPDVNGVVGAENNAWPLTIKLETVRSSAGSRTIFTASNPLRNTAATRQSCAFAESFPTGQSLQIFLGNDDPGEFLSIEKFTVKLDVELAPTPPPTAVPAPSTTVGYMNECIKNNYNSEFLSNYADKPDGEEKLWDTCTTGEVWHIYTLVGVEEFCMWNVYLSKYLGINSATDKRLEFVTACGADAT